MTLFGWLQRKYPGRFQDSQLRTLQRRVKVWRGLEGPGREVYFEQVHEPGRLEASADRGSLIHVGGNVYSVNSRLIGEKVEVWQSGDELQVWYGQKLVERLPRLRGRGKSFLLCSAH